MRSLPRPTARVRAVTQLCTSTLQNTDLSARIATILDTLEAGEADYESRGTRAELFQVPETARVGTVSRDEMQTLYTTKLSRRREPARAIYDAIMASPKYGKCPLCAERLVSTLDHYLPQTAHALFVITPLNLIPACSDCNKAKAAKQAASAHEQTLHPYFDDVDGEVWLSAKVVEDVAPVLVFAVDPPDTWSHITRDRVRAHFQMFGLRRLYAMKASQDLVQSRDYLVRLTDSAGPDGVREFLQEQAVSRGAVEKNSWQAAMYRALSRSRWFWEGGLRGIDS